MGQIQGEKTKIRAGDLFSDIYNDRIYNPEKWSGKEIKEAVRQVDHPLLVIEHGYRMYRNTSDWQCTFCEIWIKKREGYWAYKKMYLSQGEKMCHYCFLKFLAILEQNDFLEYLFDEVLKKDKKVKEDMWKEVNKSLPNLLTRNFHKEDDEK